MKVSATTEKVEPKFEPVKITVTLESKQEMVNLMTLFQQNGGHRLRELGDPSFSKDIKLVIPELQSQMGDIYYSIMKVWEDREY